MEKQNEFLETAESIIQECEDQIKDLEDIVNANEINNGNTQTDK